MKISKYKDIYGEEGKKFAKVIKDNLQKEKDLDKFLMKKVDPETFNLLVSIVINTTWKLLCSPETIKALAQKIFEQHQKATNQDTIIQALEGKRLSALKASKNLITAIEQGIITDQTKIRLKELETEIDKLNTSLVLGKRRYLPSLTLHT